MFIGNSLIAHGLVTQAEHHGGARTAKGPRRAPRRDPRCDGPTLGGRVAAVLQAIPPAPLSLEDTGIDLLDLLNLLTKVLHVRSADTFAKVSEVLKLPANLVEQLVNVAREHQLIELSSLATGGTTWQMSPRSRRKGGNGPIRLWSRVPMSVPFRSSCPTTLRGSRANPSATNACPHLRWSGRCPTW